MRPGETFGPRASRSRSVASSFGLALAVVAFAASAAYAQPLANMSDCTALGTFDQGFLGYGTCRTDENGGTGGATFGNYADGTPGNGQLMTLTARTKRGNEAVAAYWSSAEPVTHGDSETFTIGVRTSALDLRGHATVWRALITTIDGVVQPWNWQRVESVGIQGYSGPAPHDATDVEWQLVTLVETRKPHGVASMTADITTIDYPRP